MGGNYKVTPEQINAYQEDGAIVLRNVLSQKWVERMQNAIDVQLASPLPSSAELVDRDDGARFVSDMFIWLRDPDFKALFLDSPLGEIAATLMKSSEAHVFYDHLLVKEPNTDVPTPWHNDIPYWPVLGDQVISIWCGFDPVTHDSGAVKYVKGSHRWEKLFLPRNFGTTRESDELFYDTFKSDLTPPPDIDAHSDNYELLCWELEPGDVLIHHGLTLHSASGNKSSTIRRRGLALRYLGDDAVFDNRPGTFLDLHDVRQGLRLDKFKKGDKYSGPFFPRAWPPE